MPDRLFLFLGSLSGFLSVGAGAFGAHALTARLAPEQLVVFETAARYQMFHALALIAIAWVCSRWPCRLALVAGWSFVAGSVLFCASLYALALTGVRWLGAVTPLGGLAFLTGWACLCLLAWREKPVGQGG